MPNTAPKKTPGWLVAMSGATLAFGLLIAWVALPWPGAVLATAVAWMALDFGSTGTHWYRDNHDA